MERLYMLGVGIIVSIFLLSVAVWISLPAISSFFDSFTEFASIDCDRYVNPYYKQSLEEGNPQLCGKILGKLCRDNCYKDNAQAQNDELICGLVLDNETKAECYTFIAFKKNNPDLCASIEIPYLFNQCIAIAKRSPDLCSLLEPEYRRKYCYNGLARLEENESICDYIADDYVHGTCRLVIAKAKVNTSICDPIRDVSRRDSCYSSFVWIIPNESFYCDNITENSEKAGCFIDLALIKNSSSLCDLVPPSEGDVKDNCYFWIAERKMNASICNQISNNTKRSNCLKKA
ncbi:MAG: hypothetical protein KKD39_04350 [Candidatus Altiarchaeota archaeon]|nr:hypothetical protein [Candidatus Altiarchaeota archaeon]